MYSMKLIFIGDGVDLEDIKVLSKGYVDFLGQKSHEEVVDALMTARCVVAPSACWETFGLTSVEAQSVGTPSVVSDLGALPDTVEEGRSGFVFKHGDAEACAAAIRKVLSLDNESFDKMAKAARARVIEKYTEETNFAELQKIYGEAKRVMVVHNYYGSTAPSGENKVFEAEKAMLEKRGVVVETYTRCSDEIRNGSIKGLIKGALCTIANPFAARALKRKIKAFKPEVVHFHNTFPLISPLAIKAAHQAGCKVVMTLHNYRTVCPAGIPMREGKVCTDCFLGKVKVEGQGQQRNCSVFPSVRHRCYRGSLLATLPLAINVWWYRNRWAKWVDKFIVLSEFQKRKMVECGWSEEKVVVKGNFTEVSDKPIVPASERKDEILYVGRLSREKGVFTLIEAWDKLQKSLTGGGVIDGNSVVFVGLQPKEVVREMMRRAKCVFLPSEWYETFGLTVIEAMAVGTPIVVSDLGALPELVK